MKPDPGRHVCFSGVPMPTPTDSELLNVTPHVAIFGLGAPW